MREDFPGSTHGDPKGIFEMRNALWSEPALCSSGLPTHRCESAKEIVVVRGGCRKLTTAYQLVRQGHNVQVLDAACAHGLYAETGAVDIGDGYELLMRYVRELKSPAGR